MISAILIKRGQNDRLQNGIITGYRGVPRQALKCEIQKAFIQTCQKTVY